MPRKDRNDSAVYRHLLKLDYSELWDNYTTNKEIRQVLSRASKNDQGNEGFPDYLYVNAIKKLLILAEVKPSISQHIKQGSIDPEKYAVDGVKHYLKFLTPAKMSEDNLKEYFASWKIVGLAVSGDIADPYNRRISTFVLSDGRIDELRNVVDILNENEYLSLFENIDEEQIISDISATSKKINKWLRSVDSQKRPVLLSALMICLFEVDGFQNDFRNGYSAWSAPTIIKNIPPTVKQILARESIPTEKIEVINAGLTFMEHDQDLNNTNVLKDILNELRDSVIPLFKRKSNYDIIGKFYEEFLRYAGVANVKKGIVLTPRHITSLFVELIDLRVNDIILDPACGTGAFLIAAMNKLMDTIDKTPIPNKATLTRNLKERQLIGFEKNATMFSLAISNMLFRGDGKSRIFHCDYFSRNADDILDDLRQRGIVPTIGLINPPYGGKDNGDNPTKKEIQFLTRMLDHVSRYGVIIAPLSTYFKDESTRRSILTKHTLRYVINMPKDLFMPNAATNTAIAVFETNKPHGDQDVVFYDLKDDGFVLSKSKGRTDVYNKWSKIRIELIEKLSNPGRYADGINLVKSRLNPGDEWVIQAHAKTDYSGLTENAFISSIKQYMIFQAKQQMNLLEEELDEVTLLQIVSDYYSNSDERGVGETDGG
ncbi:MAG: N-6 DNA methylase [Dechloromonas sp.]|nr:N-6 DNA methylase [Dechloromonas sp.]